MDNNVIQFKGRYNLPALFFYDPVISFDPIKFGLIC